MSRYISYRDFDWVLLGFVLAICTLGVFQIHSATEHTKFAGAHLKQVYWILGGLGAMFLVSLINYQALLEQVHWMYVVALAPFPSNQLNDLQLTDHDTFFLSSIWMSGYGLAADDAGNIVFVTGNSDANSYDGVTNIQESVVKVNSTLTTVVDLFTPDNQVSLDQGDVDFGSGGVLVLPDQPGSIPHMAAAAGKDGNLYFMNEDNLGGYSPNQNNVLGTYSSAGAGGDSNT